MRRIILPLLLALSSLAFAPAPLPRPDRETPKQKEARELAALARRLDELGVRWRVDDGPDGRAVRYRAEVWVPDVVVGILQGAVGVTGGGLARALRHGRQARRELLPRRRGAVTTPAAGRDCRAVTPRRPSTTATWSAAPAAARRGRSGRAPRPRPVARQNPSSPMTGLDVTRYVCSALVRWASSL